MQFTTLGPTYLSIRCDALEYTNSKLQVGFAVDPGEEGTTPEEMYKINKQTVNGQDVSGIGSAAFQYTMYGLPFPYLAMLTSNKKYSVVVTAARFGFSGQPAFDALAMEKELAKIIDQNLNKY